MRPLEWQHRLLERHGLERPDGRPLYQYRVTEEEFSELETLLKLSAPLGFQNVVFMLKWDAAFVMFAAEWWRRYSDGRWAWEGIFSSIGIPSDEVQTSERNSLVELGLMRWTRDVRAVHGRRRFLGTVATEGGLPLNRLKDAGGWLNNVLRQVLRRHIARGLDVSTLLEGYRERIPQSFQVTEILQILEDLILCVADIRKNHKLDDQQNPVAWLDKHDMGWRDRFPLPMESVIANTLIVGLIQEASATREFSESDVDGLFFLERYLVNEGLALELKAKLVAPTFFPLELFVNNQIDLDRSRYDFELVSDAGVRQSWGRAFRAPKVNMDGYSFTGRTKYLDDENVLDELKLEIKSEGELLGSIPVMNAYRLDLNEPWLFTTSDGQSSLQGISSQKTKKNEAVVYIPSSLQIRPDECSDLLTLKPFYKGKLYELSGKVDCVSDELALLYCLETKATDSFLQYELDGMTFERSSKPGAIYIGTPTVVERNTLTGSANRRNRHQLSAKRSGSSDDWAPLGEDSFGVYEVRVLDEQGITLTRRRIGVLPKVFDWDLEIDRRNPKVGKVILKGLPRLNISQADSSVAAVQSFDEKIGDVVLLEALEDPPISVKLDLMKAGDTRELTLDLPFPSAGARLFDASGKMLRRGDSLLLSSLHGYRIKVFCEHGVKAVYADLRIELLDNFLERTELRDLYINKRLKLKPPATEFAVIDFLEDFKRLLGASSNLDASVKLTIVLNGRTELNHQIHRYDCELDRDSARERLALPASSCSGLSLDEQEKVELDAVLLNQPEANVFPPQRLDSEGVFLGEWEFESLKRKTGLWFVFPTASSKIFFRPILWPLGNSGSHSELDDFNSIETLQRAVWVANPRSRREAIRIVLRKMTSNYSHSGWDYLKALADKCLHLPLSAFDVWSVAATEPSFLASLVTHVDLNDIVDKMVDELPVLWELVSYSDWERAISVYQEHYHKVLSGHEESIDPAIVGTVRQLIKGHVLERIESLSPALESTRKRLESEFLRIENIELKIFELPFGTFLEKQIKQFKQNLISRNFESDWPIVLQGALEEQAESLPAELKRELNVFREYQKSVILLPAVLASRQAGLKDSLWIGDTVTVFKLQQIKAFDSEWFESLFNYISAWFHYQNKER